MFSGNIKYPFALDKDRKITNIINATRGDTFTCVFCENKMIAKKGEIYSHHFAHVGICTETWRYDQMTQWHKDWQNEFPKECQEKLLKRENTKHIADILIGNYVIEFQHSKISDKEFLERNSFYTSMGYKLIWVFDFINGDNDTNIDILCKAFKIEKQDIFIYKETPNKTLQSIDGEETIDRSAFVNEIKNNKFHERGKPFSSDRYYKYINNKKRESENIVATEESDYYQALKDYAFASEKMPSKRSLPRNGDSINTTNSDKLYEIIELNRGKNYWLICENTGKEYYFENTESDSTMKVWIKLNESATSLDEVHQWRALFSFKAYRWTKIG